jgi:hypothetical protein
MVITYNQVTMIPQALFAGTRTYGRVGSSLARLGEPPIDETNASVLHLRSLGLPPTRSRPRTHMTNRRAGRLFLPPTLSDSAMEPAGYGHGTATSGDKSWFSWMGAESAQPIRRSSILTLGRQPRRRSSVSRNAHCSTGTSPASSPSCCHGRLLVARRQCKVRGAHLADEGDYEHRCLLMGLSLSPR